MTSPDELAIEVKGLVKRFGDVVAVDGIDLDIRRGECVGLLGPNGAGKTTTVEILEGLQEPTSGHVRLLGLDWKRSATQLRQRIGLTLQETRLVEHLTVEETVKMFASFYPRPLPVEELIGMVQLGEKRGARVGKLSGGQRQRLALALGLAGDPDLFFLDEPTTGLDPQSRRALWDVVVALKARGRTVVLTTHYMDEAEVLCDRLVIIDKGRVMTRGTPGEIIASLGADQVIELEADPALDLERLRPLPAVVSAQRHADRLSLRVKELHVALPSVLREVELSGARLRHLSTRRSTLDDVFIGLTGRSLREGTEEKAA
ncbi:ABC transporter ATP-binding protein [Myxococcus llanfairpwllgwyngyllgogerychwyrndrobwllllantysiliogogogochensis]|uniref:ABC transporter ATP-binding protein n=1 Tax=Myxococcus llanfairpwllgwyngyllgogerychwyrndrobwllllantysiliogogogochensis TaxID=2590453 RepID=A0A540X611_9BACT|nr:MULTISPECIES: ABC transporter ATP-binding protein [Myxococcus]NTX15083.1 ABC transporter ATP-binding protein [Myxococcus sp. CA056]NTX36086.1 ABC transporter ATP-binding protein [Myxococcus sp. CA033]TQF16706.1 ABC transporter ATP-binding protein [Myxococcus llanfairpwllgwyngyllgogerychwyrndrobwllllantysiliogogogochensis]